MRGRRCLATLRPTIPPPPEQGRSLKGFSFLLYSILSEDTGQHLQFLRCLFFIARYSFGRRSLKGFFYCNVFYWKKIPERFFFIARYSWRSLKGFFIERRSLQGFYSNVFYWKQITARSFLLQCFLIKSRSLQGSFLLEDIRISCMYLLHEGC